LKGGEMVNEVKNAHDDIATCVKFTPDEKYFVSTSK
jgi:WD40 repeat protein